MTHPFRDVAIVGVFNTHQARRLPGTTLRPSRSRRRSVPSPTPGIDAGDVDGVVGQAAADAVLELGLGPCVRRPSGLGIPAIVDAAALIATGQCRVVLVLAGGAGLRSHGSAAPWTTPPNELVAGFGLFTAAEFALMARRHMVTYGTTEHQLATAAAVIRTNGHHNPEAVYHGRGPFTAGGHPGVAPGGGALPPPRLRHDLRGRVRARAGPAPTSHGMDHGGRSGSSAAAATATGPPTPWRPSGTSPRVRACEPAGWVGSRSGRRPPSPWPGSVRGDVDVAEFYDPFSFEIIRQLEAYGFCEPGEGGPMVESGAIGPGGSAAGHHRRRHDVLQPPGDRGTAVPAGDAWRAAAARRVSAACRSTAQRSRCARTAAPVRCSPTCCSWARSAREHRRMPACSPRRRPASPCPVRPRGPSRSGSGCREGRLVLPMCSACGARALRAFAVCPQCTSTDAGLGAERRPGNAVQLDGGLASSPPGASSCPTPPRS